VKDPKDYRFCGYGEAMGGAEPARWGLGKVLCSLSPASGWKEAAREYRKLLYALGTGFLSPFNSPDSLLIGPPLSAGRPHAHNSAPFRR
jgi:hypothetical protein